MPETDPESTPCTNCAALLTYRSAGSYGLICPQCQTLHYRTFRHSSPKMKPVQEDLSLIRIGTTGQGGPEGLRFEVIGRLQYFFREHYRNHWFVLYNDSSTGWLGEWEGYYSFFKRIDVPGSRFDKPAAGKPVQINQEEYLTERLDTCRYISAEGELGRFTFSPDPFLTLEFYTVDTGLALAHVFADQTTEAFTGHYRELGELNLQNLRLHHDWV